MKRFTKILIAAVAIAEAPSRLLELYPKFFIMKNLPQSEQSKFRPLSLDYKQVAAFIRR